MIKLINEKPKELAEAKSIQYHFDGKEWYRQWEAKLDASIVLMESAHAQAEEIRRQVTEGKLSPLAYHIHTKSFGTGVLSAYTGISKHNIQKHLKPENFEKLDENTLKKYAAAFEISVEELKNV